jgi:RNA polymerase sigma-70 factor (ECF subfamily)
MTNPEQITELLQRISQGDEGARELLIPEVYGELRRIASRYLSKERKGHTLQPTALVNEMFVKFLGTTTIPWQSRAHFFGIAAKVMRRYLTDHARHHSAKKRGGTETIIALDERSIASQQKSMEAVALDEALNRLEKIDERRAKVVEMRFYGGMTEEEVAEVMGCSSRTVKRDWEFARAWLYGELKS